MSAVQTLAVIGAGQMGGGIGQVAALAGLNVIVYDSFPGATDKCRAGYEKMFPKSVEKAKKLLDDADASKAKPEPQELEFARRALSGGGAALSRVKFVSTLEDLAGADWVVEAVVEDAKVKKDIFATLVSILPDERVVLASNTSSISITDIATAAGPHAHRVVGMHFFNPVALMKLVEIIPALQSSQEVLERTRQLSLHLGKTPLRANDRAGFVSNRVLMPMINEAFYAWMEGVAEPEAIDGIMKLGCNFPMGPLRLADFIGLDTCVHIMNVLADGLNNDRYRACPLLKQLVIAGRLGDKVGRGVYELSKK